MNQLLFQLTPLQKDSKQKKKKQIKKLLLSYEDEMKSTHHTHPQYKDTIENADKYIKQLSKKSFDKLAKNLDIIRTQMDWAIKDKKYSAFELLQEWERQHIAARLKKFDKEAKGEIKKVKGE